VSGANVFVADSKPLEQVVVRWAVEFLLQLLLKLPNSPAIFDYCSYLNVSILLIIASLWYVEWNLLVLNRIT
jgi:hypothetical protein